MRICLVSQAYPPETGHGGIASQTQTKARFLARAGHDVIVLSHSPDDGRHILSDGPVAVHRIPGPAAASEIERWESWSAAIADALDELLQENQIDLIDFPEYGAEAYSHLSRRSTSRPAVAVHLQGPLGMLHEGLGWPDRESELYRRGIELEARCLKMADAVYSSSRYTAKWTARHYLEALNEEIPVMHSGVDLEHFRPSATRRSRPTVLFAGKVGPSKGADVLERAMASVVERVPEAVARVFGTPVDGTAERMRGSTGFEVFDHLERETLAAELAAAHVLAMPSPFEGGPGFIYLEAMACGTPVIACSGSGMDEIIEDGVTGFLIDTGDADALTESLTWLLSDPERGARGGKQGDPITDARQEPRPPQAGKRALRNQLKTRARRMRLGFYRHGSEVNGQASRSQRMWDGPQAQTEHQPGAVEAATA